MIVLKPYISAVLHDYWPPYVSMADEDEDDGPPDPPKCEDCKGRGKIPLFTGEVDCERCGGSGY